MMKELILARGKRFGYLAISAMSMNLGRIADMLKKWFKRSDTEAQCAFTEVYLKNHGWKKLLSQGEYGTHEGLDGIYYLVDGFGKVHEKYCKHFR